VRSSARRACLIVYGIHPDTDLETRRLLMTVSPLESLRSPLHIDERSAQTDCNGITRRPRWYIIASRAFEREPTALPQRP